MGKLKLKSPKNNDKNDENSERKERKEELFKYVDGRRYHNVLNLKYYLPNDDEEFNRLQMQHYLSRFIWQSNYSAPVHELLKNGGEDVRILDVGCGPGTWILEMASDYPRTGLFHGIDIAPLFPTFSTEQWESVVLPELVRVTKPGGYIEIMEWDIKIHGQGPIAKRLMDSFSADLRSRDIYDCIVELLPEFMKKPNQLTNIEHESRDNPLGSHDKLDKLALDNAVSIFRMYKPKFSKDFDLTFEEYDKLNGYL